MNGQTPQPQARQTPQPAARPDAGRRQALARGAAILLSGVILGAAAAVALPQYFPGGRAGGRQRPTAAQIAVRIQERCGLTEAQRAGVEAILAAHFERLDLLREAMRPQLEADFATLKAEMQDVLTPEQYAVWLKHVEERRKRHMP